VTASLTPETVDAGDAGGATAAETPKERLAYWGYRSAAALGRALPERVGRPAFDAVGAIGARVLPGIRSTVAANQARVLGVDAASEVANVAARRAFRLYARYWYDTFHLPAWSPEEVASRTTSDGFGHVEAALGGGRGIVCALPHMGNWDATGYWLSAQGYRVASVAEVLRPPRLFDLFLRHREALGMRIVPLAGGGGVGRQLSALLSDNWIVALVADRDLSGRGVEVEMFGAPRRLPAGPALLALASGAPLLVAALYTRPDGWHVHVDPPLDLEPTGDRRADVRGLTRRIAEAFERSIAAQPNDWHLFQPGWATNAPTTSDASDAS